MTYIFIIIIFFAAISVVGMPAHAEFSKETANEFIDKCINTQKLINQCKTRLDVELVIKNEIRSLREKYKKSVDKRLFRSRMGELYAHGYNSIIKNKSK